MENKKELRSWLDDLKLSHPLVIAGPCSAETEEQVLRIVITSYSIHYTKLYEIQSLMSVILFSLL